MPKTAQLVVSLESKPGVLAKVCRTLADANVNITGLCAPETTGRAKIRLLVAELPRAREALKAAKYRVTEEAALALVPDTVEFSFKDGAVASLAVRG